jgi:hypothetical protein
MKKLVPFLVIIMLTACEKLFHEEAISIGKIKNYEELLTATCGVYGALVNAVSENSFYSANIKGDDINLGWLSYLSYYFKEDRYGYRDYNTDYYSSDWASFSSFGAWKSLYKTLLSANNIISQFVPVQSQDKRTREILGEIYLIRAYCHFRLTRTYGLIPLVDNIEIDYHTPKASYAEIYRFIENDLKMAMELLPANNSSARIPYVTPHRGAAKAILAEVYLSWAGYPAGDASKYLLAAKEAGEVIDSSEYFGFELLGDFAWVWDKQHLINAESVFSVCHPDPADPTNARLYYDHRYYSTGIYSGLTNGGGINFVFFPPDFYLTLSFPPAEVKFFNDFPPGYRKDITFYTTFYIPHTDWIDSPYDTGYFHIDRITKMCDRPGYRKFYIDSSEVDYYEPEYVSAFGVPYNLYTGIPRVYLFRYAQTLLTYAEAAARSGQLNAKAYECVNMIRRRARNVDIYSSSEYDLQGLSEEAFADSVVWERAWELAGEPEGRWYDLVRLEQVEELPEWREPNETGPPDGVYNKSVYFSPIPQSDQILNPNLSGP